MNLKRKFKCTSRIEKQDLILGGEKEKSLFQNPRNFVGEIGFGARVSLVLRKAAKSWVVRFWSGLNVYVRT